MKILLALKTEYKSLTGKDWKPGMMPQSSQMAQSTGNDDTSGKSQGAGGDCPNENSPEVQELKANIESQGIKVRELKTGGADKVSDDGCKQ